VENRVPTFSTDIPHEPFSPVKAGTVFRIPEAVKKIIGKVQHGIETQLIGKGKRAHGQVGTGFILSSRGRRTFFSI